MDFFVVHYFLLRKFEAKFCRANEMPFPIVYKTIFKWLNFVNNPVCRFQLKTPNSQEKYRRQTTTRLAEFLLIHDVTIF